MSLGYLRKLNDTPTNDKSLSSNDITRKEPDRPLLMPFTLQGIEWCENDMILAVGGGGPSKTGMSNGFEILKLDENTSEQKGKKELEWILRRDSWYNTGIDIVYCICIHPKYPYQLIAAVSNSIIIMELSNQFDEESKDQNACRFEWKVLAYEHIYIYLYPCTIGINCLVVVDIVVHILYTLCSGV